LTTVAIARFLGTFAIVKQVQSLVLQGLAGRGEVTCRAGADLRDPQRKVAGVAQELRSAAEGVVLAGVPPVVSALGAGGDPVGSAQGAVQA
jgi:hypothetical protein